MTFKTFSLHPKILKAIEDAGYSEPTEIQEKAIPQILTGTDLRASAQTGTGKTAAFLLPALHLLASSDAKKEGKGPLVLILVPTRELGMQIAVQAEKYSKYLNRIKIACVYGGVPYHEQLRKLSKPYDILIATPGRLIDYLEKRKISFPRLEMIVLDEADRMLDMGFVEPVKMIVSSAPAKRQTLLFSATMKGSVLKLSQELLNSPVDIAIAPESIQNENIEQKLFYVDDINHKNKLLDHLLLDAGPTILFTATKRHADQLAEELQEKGHSAAALHGDMRQRQRTKTIGLLRSGKVKILVATDVAARGIDVLSITHVINFDLPQCSEDYVHRIGRTGRAGAKGLAFSFASRRDAHLVKGIEKYTGQLLDVGVIEGLEPRKQEKKKPRPFKRQFAKRRFRDR